MTRVVHCQHEPYDVLIDRTTEWGNPFVIGVHGNRPTVLAKHRAWLRRQPDLMARIGTLKGLTLGCHCKPLDCHGDTLAEFAEQT